MKWGKEVIFILRPLLPHFMYVVWLAILSSSVSSRCLTSGSLRSLFCLVIFKHDQGRCVLKGGREGRTVEAGAGPEEALEERNWNDRKKEGLRLRLYDSYVSFCSGMYLKQEGKSISAQNQLSPKMHAAFTKSFKQIWRRVRWNTIKG